MSFPAVLVIVALSGFIALSYEILWVRAFGFLLAGSTETFGLLLGFYLLGLAFGSLFSMRVCRDDRKGSLGLVALCVLAAGVTSYLTVPAFARLAPYARWIPEMLIVAVAAGALGAVLPLVSHFGIAPDDRAGARLSYVYLANIIGSATGSLLTGFVLLDVARLSTISVGLLITSLLLAMGLLLAGKLPRARLLASLAGIAATGTLLVLGAPRAFDRIYERLHFRDRFTNDIRYASVIENKSGVIAVTPDGALYSSGIYDGYFNTRLTGNHNVIERAYAAGMLKPNAKEVLLVGLGSGSWAQVLAHMPGVEKLTAVEINPAYVDLIRKYPEVKGLLDNPKVDIRIDDARRYLNRTDKRFDLIVVNMTWHCRAHAVNLLSREFLELCRSHLNPGGVHYFNTTWSEDVMKTAAAVYPRVYRFHTFVAGGMGADGDGPMAIDPEAWRSYLTDFRIEGKPVLDLSRPEDQKALDLAVQMVRPGPRSEVESHESLVARTSWATVVTDDNMQCEWAAWDRGPPGFQMATQRPRGGRFIWSD